VKSNANAPTTTATVMSALGQRGFPDTGIVLLVILTPLCLWPRGRKMHFAGPPRLPLRVSAYVCSILSFTIFRIVNIIISIEKTVLFSHTNLDMPRNELVSQ
jgi:hypothetical protein